MALVNTTPVNGAALPILPPGPGTGALPTESFLLLGFGTWTANSGTPVTVAAPGVTANSLILFTLKTVGGTVAAPFVATITAGTGFNANSGGSDTSVYNYLIFG